MDQQLHTYSVQISRYAREKNPLAVIDMALKQAQAENALLSHVYAEDITHDEAGFYYTKNGSFYDLTLWCNSKEDLHDILTIIRHDYSWGNDLEYNIDTSPRTQQ